MAVGSIVARILTQYSDKGSKAASKDIMKLGKSFDGFSKKVGKAFLIAGAAAAAFALKIGKDAVQAALADQKSQALLANTLRNTTGATDETIAVTENYITQLQKQFSVVDDDLRPAFARLAALTGSTAQAQTLLGTALDISASSGADLATATGALIKASAGQFKGLKNLVPSLSAATMKSKDFGAALDEVSKATAGAAGNRAKTLEFRIQGLRIAFGEVLETLGYALLPVLEKFAVVLQNQLIPKFETFIALNKDKLAEGFKKGAEFAVKLLTAAIGFSDWVSKNTATIAGLAAIIATMFVGSKIAGFIVLLASLTKAFATLRTTAAGAAIAAAFATGGASAIGGAIAVAGITAAIGLTAYKLADNNSKTNRTNGIINSNAPMSPGASDVINGFGKKSVTSTGNPVVNALDKNTTAVKKNTKSIIDIATENAMKELAARQKALSGSASIAIGGGGKLYGPRNANGVVVNVNAGSVVGSPDALIRVVADGIASANRRNGGSMAGGRNIGMLVV
jgi:hypothetical protein